MKPEGIITAMVTPLDRTNSIDLVVTKQLVNHLIDKNVNGLFILGTNGEFHVLSDLEKLRFAETVINETNGRLPVFIGTGGNSTDHVVSLSKEMTALGADALSVITPYFVQPTETELMNHYFTIADANIAPIMLYNIPKNTGISISSNTVRKLAGHQNIIGIKDSSGKIDNLKEYLAVSKEQNFSVLSGSDSLILDALKIGATGAIAATSNVLTEIDVAIYQYWLEGKVEKAQIMQNSIEEFRRILTLGTIPSVLKAAISYQGINVGDPRLPVLPLSDEVLSEIAQTMDYYKENFSFI
ncbi:dihydrodipicolinate synthase [Enterococcus haemoperoxidus ATCC BAA-382]|uniref:4-hydroxy-tetrahydrodipicolinate synthase n=1 Tax=Enterococcus haemoperoxidus ATCC BAA-382 TaxID=1158608 RepID=R2QPS0_9ENTE|nr:4-hydroxy-tetrahydrodipicolinate synthase [Enterococcus haemoperoxidus]EOH98487.1 dihydrodipicolinate synthase [Enterococcus haemoperoxidus ATCC BAA-382]EOT62330.1 dihydrodipicolinate synthase [Enterococcus haemoperoxidus ATCC BAA-382]OJG55588.1 dihydrodipicolinate synthase [Enterococcus haemoperoxidus]